MKTSHAIVALSASLVFFSCTQSKNQISASQNLSKPSAAHEDPEGYYTCSMHPQVHEHEPGKCPICGMALIKVNEKNNQPAQVKATTEIQATSTQLSLAGISKYTVIRKDLKFKIPVSGRLLSNREVVFQVYESDLDLVKPGLLFVGAPSFDDGKRRQGKIRSIDNLLDPASRTARVAGELLTPLKNAVIEGGFSGEIQIELNSQIAVPEDAVLHTGLSDLVYLITSDDSLKPTPVTLGKRAGSDYQILGGLKEGDVISRGSNFLIDSESKIRGNAEIENSGTVSPIPACPDGEHWDVPMSMCMPGKE